MMMAGSKMCRWAKINFFPFPAFGDFLFREESRRVDINRGTFRKSIEVSVGKYLFTAPPVWSYSIEAYFNMSISRD